MSWLSQLLERNSSDPRVRLELGQELLDHLAVSRLPSDTKIINEFCDVVFQWLASSNFKVGAAKELVLKLSESTSQLIVPSVVESSTRSDGASEYPILENSSRFAKNFALRELPNETCSTSVSYFFLYFLPYGRATTNFIIDLASPVVVDQPFPFAPYIPFSHIVCSYQEF